MGGYLDVVRGRSRDGNGNRREFLLPELDLAHLALDLVRHPPILILLLLFSCPLLIRRTPPRDPSKNYTSGSASDAPCILKKTFNRMAWSMTWTSSSAMRCLRSAEESVLLKGVIRRGSGVVVLLDEGGAAKATRALIRRISDAIHGDTSHPRLPSQLKGHQQQLRHRYLRQQTHGDQTPVSDSWACSQLLSTPKRQRQRRVSSRFCTASRSCT